MKISTIIGARPQFIKAAAVSRAIAAHNLQLLNSEQHGAKNPGAVLDYSCGRSGTLPLIEEVLIHTGQHYDEGMSDIFFRELEIPEPKYNLNIGSGSHGRQTGQMLAALENVLIGEKPDWVLVYGDTNSTLAGALAAAKLHIPIAHIEAGLRSFNRRMPEEINRIVADQLSTLLLCPSQAAVNNLAAEGISNAEGISAKSSSCLPTRDKKRQMRVAKLDSLTPRGTKVVITGDVMADALLFASEHAAGRSDLVTRLGLQPRSYLLATIHRAENTDDPERLRNILLALSELAKHEPVILPLHPRTKKILADMPSLKPGQGTLHADHYYPSTNRTCGLVFLEPVGYFDIIALEKSARFLLTDSGGMQKEAYWLKIPCITLREETEWVETVAAGWNILAGADFERIIETVRSFNTPPEHPSLYGDGQAAAHCLNALLAS